MYFNNLVEITKVGPLNRGLDVEQLFLLELLFYEKQVALQVYLAKFKLAKIKLTNLETDCYITLNEKTHKYELTQRGRDIFNMPKRRRIEDLVDEFRELFPKGVRTAGYLVKGDRNGCIKKMKKFIKENPDVKDDEILAATEAYIKKMALNGYDRMKLAHYFIEKDGASTLSAEIESLRISPEKSFSFTRDL